MTAGQKYEDLMSAVKEIERCREYISSPGSVVDSFLSRAAGRLRNQAEELAWEVLLFKD